MLDFVTQNKKSAFLKSEWVLYLIRPLESENDFLGIIDSLNKFNYFWREKNPFFKKNPKISQIAKKTHALRHDYLTMDINIEKKSHLEWDSNPRRPWTRLEVLYADSALTN